MITPRELGRLAQQSGIGAPSLDQSLNNWLNEHADAEKAEYLADWWAGWYAGLDEKISNAGAIASRGYS